MDTVSEVAEDIYQIDTLVRMPHPVIVYFIRDRHPALVESGTSSAVPAIREALRYLGQSPSSLAYVFLTHAHLDHGGGAGYLAHQLPEVRVVVHPQGARHLSDPSRLIAGAREVFGEDFARRYGEILPVPERQIQVMQGEEVISLGGRELKAISSPGHSAHHLCFYESRTGGLFVGDALGSPLPDGNFALPPVALPRFDLPAYLDTLKRLGNLSPSLLCYSHNGARWDVEKQFRVAYDSLKVCFRIVAEAMKVQESPQQMAERFQPYVPRETLGESEFLFQLTLAQIYGLLRENGALLDRFLSGIEETPRVENPL